MAHSAFSRKWLLALAFVFPGALAFAAEPADQLLPWVTKGYLSSSNLAELKDKFHESSLGQFVNDDAMKPFVDDMKKQLKERLAKAGVQLGIKLEDLQGIASGEVAIAAVQPDPLKKDSHAQVLIVDVTGNEAKLNELLAEVEKNQVEKGAKKSTRDAEGVHMTLYVFPKRPDQITPDYAVHYVKDGQLVVVDHLGVADDIAKRFGKKGFQSLSWMPSYRYIMKHQATAAGDKAPQLKWYVEPFGFAEVTRAAAGGKKKRGMDMIKVLASQGFSCVQGIGGYVFVKTENEELMHRTFVYAPAVARKEGDKNKDKYDLAARMLNFPNTDNLQPQDWVPAHSANYLSFNWKMQAAFGYVGTLVDAIADQEGVFEEVLLSLEKDPKGPKINVRDGLVKHLKERATFITDYRLPIDTKSERWLAAIEIDDAEVVAETVKKAFENDPSAKKRVFENHVIWEIVHDEQVQDIPELSIEGPGGTQFAVEEVEDEEESKPMLPNSAITVWKGHLIVSSHVDFVHDLLKGKTGAEAVGDTAAYKQVNEALERLGGGSDAFRYFAKTDECYRPTYELIRQGKMPEAETLLAKALNALMAPKEEGSLRTQQIDGNKLPEFETVRKYFGPAGVYVRSVDDGWEIVGCLLKKSE